MGILHTQRGRLASALVLTIIVAAVVFGALAVTENASAQTTFTECATCHTYTYGDAFHSKTTHAAQTCAKCHTVNTSTPPLPSSCSSCHGTPTQIIAAQAAHQTATPACSAVGCHGASPTPTPTPTPTATAVATTVTAKVAPTAIKLHKTVKVSGAVTPATTLAGTKVALRVDFKKGAKWLKTKTATATVATTGTYIWKYKPAKKGSFRVMASIAATATYKASKTAYKTFKVK